MHPSYKAEADVDAAAPRQSGAVGGSGAPRSKYADPKERARHAALVRWGKEKPMTFQQRLEAVRARRKARKARRAAGRAAKPKKPTLTPEQREQQQAAERAQNVASVGDALNAADNEFLSKRGLEGLTQGASGEEPDGPIAEGLIKKGLAVRGEDGRFRLTSDGKAILRAAESGDTNAVLDKISEVNDKNIARGEREKERSTRAAEREQKKAEREAARAARAAEREKAKAERAEKKPSGGGGASRAKSPEDRAVERSQRAQETAESVGLDGDALSSLRDAAEQGGAKNPKLKELGLVDDSGDATDQGRRALTALERGDVRQYRAALQDAAGRMEREGARRTREQERLGAEMARAQNERGDREARARQERADARAFARRLEERRRRRGANPAARARKAMDDILDKLEAEADSLAALGDAEIKAGRALSAANMQKVQDAHDLARDIRDAADDICEMCVELGAEGEGYEEGGDVEMVEDEAPMKAASTGTATVTPDDVQWSYTLGSEVKAVGDSVRALAIRFGTEDEPDMSHVRDYFTKTTDLWLDAWDRRPMLYHHALDESTQDAPRIGTWTKATVTDEGVWLEGQLDRAHRYYGAIKELIKRGALRVSSDSAPHLVLREARRNGTHEVKRWPLLAASLTPTPAEPRLPGVSLKSILAELGDVEIDDDPEAQDDDQQRADGLKADQDRARRLLLQAKIIALQE